MEAHVLRCRWCGHLRGTQHRLLHTHLCLPADPPQNSWARYNTRYRTRAGDHNTVYRKDIGAGRLTYGAAPPGAGKTGGVGPPAGRSYCVTLVVGFQ